MGMHKKILNVDLLVIKLRARGAVNHSLGTSFSRGE